MRFVLTSLVSTVSLLVLLTSRGALAFERQWHLGAGAGVASYAGVYSGVSPALGIHAAYGLSDMFDLRAEILGSRHVADDGRTLGIFSSAAGIAYKIDVLEWIPYVGLLGGYYYFDAGSGTDGVHDVALSVALGLDYALSRSFGLGVQFRYHGLLLEAPDSFTDAAYFTGLLRAEYRFGW